MFCVSENKENIPYVYVNIAAFRIRNVESRKRVGDQSEFSTRVKWIIKHQTVWRILRTKINVESQPTNLRSCFAEIFISLVCYHVTWRPCWMTTQCNFCCAEFAWTRFKFPRKLFCFCENELIIMSRAWDKEKIWVTRQDSNLWPPKHRASALSTWATENSWKASFVTKHGCREVSWKT